MTDDIEKIIDDLEKEDERLRSARRKSAWGAVCIALFWITLGVVVAKLLVGCTHAEQKKLEAMVFDADAIKINALCENEEAMEFYREGSRDVWQRTYNPNKSRGHYKAVCCANGKGDCPEKEPSWLRDSSWEYGDCPSKYSPLCEEGIWSVPE